MTHPTPPPLPSRTPAPAPPRQERGGSRAAVGLFFLGLFAWLAAFVAWSMARDDASSRFGADTTPDYGIAYLLALAGATLIVCGVIYDVGERLRR